MTQKEDLINSLNRIKKNLVRYINIEINALKKEAAPILDRPIGDLDLSNRAHTVLWNAGIERIGDLVDLSRKDLLRIKNFGLKRLIEVGRSLENHGLSLKGMWSDY